MPTWDDWTKLTAVALFGVALFCLTLSICFTVLKVLRPTRGPRTKHFLGETVADIWGRGDVRELLAATGHELRLLRFDRAIRTVPEWHVRNRQKARWLRRAWVFLALGVVAIAIASVFVVTHTLGIEHDRGDIARDINEWHVLAFIVLLGILAALAVGFDWIRAGRGDPDEDRDLAELVVAAAASSASRRLCRRRLAAEALARLLAGHRPLAPAGLLGVVHQRVEELRDLGRAEPGSAARVRESSNTISMSKYGM